MKFTSYLAAYFLTSYISFTKCQVFSEATTQFPAIYVGAGSVSCGSSLAPDLCSQLPNPIYSYVPNVTTLTWKVQSYVEGSQALSSSSIYYTPLINIPCSAWLPLTRTSLETGYVPTVIVPGVTPSAGATPAPKTARAMVESQCSNPELKDTHLFTCEQHRKKERRGYYDYDSCNGAPPDHDMVTNSLVDVCHFVANAQSYFVSLRPTSAAYMPSWIGFMFQTIVCIWNMILLVRLSLNSADFQITSESKEYDDSPNKWKLAFNISTAIYGVMKIVLAIITIARHKDSFDALPFISPIIWFDIVPLLNLAIGFGSIHLAIITGIMGLCLYGTCFWLCIGYGLRGFGSRQYEVLDIPAFCKSLDIHWQTDPRRRHFVRLQSVLFSFGSVGLFAGLTLWMQIEGGLESFTFNPSNLKIFGRKPIDWDKDFSSTQIIQTVVGSCIIIPEIVGLIMAGVLNGHSYLILGQKHCYASFVSGRFGYLNDYWVDWLVKVSTWLGLNT